MTALEDVPSIFKNVKLTVDVRPDKKINNIYAILKVFEHHKIYRLIAHEEHFILKTSH